MTSACPDFEEPAPGFVAASTARKAPDCAPDAIGKPISFDRRTISAKPAGGVGDGIAVIGVSRRNWGGELVKHQIGGTQYVTVFNWCSGPPLLFHVIPDAVQHVVLHCRSGTHPG